MPLVNIYLPFTRKEEILEREFGHVYTGSSHLDPVASGSVASSKPLIGNRFPVEGLKSSTRNTSWFVCKDGEAQRVL